MDLKFGIKNIINFLMSLIAIWYAVFMFIITIEERSDYYLSTFLFTLALFVALFIYMVKNAISQVVPKYYKVMRVVHKYITFSDLRELVKDEVFEPVELPLRIQRKHPKRNIKAFKRDFLVSENWVYANKVMIPKNMIVAVRPSFYRKLDIFYFTLVDKSDYEFATFSSSGNESKVYFTKYFSQNEQISNIRNITNAEQYIEKFKNEVRTKEDFLRFIGQEI